MMKKLFLFISIISMSIMACDSDDAVIQEVTGRIFEATSQAGLDGCGWMVEIDGEVYQPTYLNSQYRQEDLRVFMNVEFLDERANCSVLALAPGLVRIEQIRPAGN